MSDEEEVGNEGKKPRSNSYVLQAHHLTGFLEEREKLRRRLKKSLKKTIALLFALLFVLLILTVHLGFSAIYSLILEIIGSVLTPRGIALALIPLMLVALLVAFGLLTRIFPRMASKAEWLRRWIPPSLFLFGIAFYIYLMVLLIWYVKCTNIDYETPCTGDETPWGLIAIIITVNIGVVLPWSLPTVWNIIERLWWKMVLGRSPVAHRLKQHATNDLDLSTGNREIDNKYPRQFAFLLALNDRLVGEFARMHRDLLREKDDREKQLFKSTVDNLNEGWRSGLPQRILKKYMEFIERTSDDIEDDWERFRGQCTLANVDYFLGYVPQARERAKKNWNKAKKDDDDVLKWMASYAYFNAKELPDEEVTKEMFDHWEECYEGEKQSKREEIARKLSSMKVNPVLFIPRHLILDAALNGLPPVKGLLTTKKALSNWRWPKEVSASPPDKYETELELEWVKYWHEKAIKISRGDRIDYRIAHDISHAYAGFYFTLLYLDSRGNPRTPLQEESREEAKEKAKSAFKKMEEGEPPTISRYARSGFEGIYKFVTEDKPDGALESLRKAREYSATGGNRFAAVECLFICCRAIAAQRAKQYLEPEVDYCLKESIKLAEKTKQPLYTRLCNEAATQVSKMRGETDSGKSLYARLRNEAVIELEREARGDEPDRKNYSAVERISLIFREVVSKMRGQTGLADEMDSPAVKRILLILQERKIDEEEKQQHE